MSECELSSKRESLKDSYKVSDIHDIVLGNVCAINTESKMFLLLLLDGLST